MPRFGVDGERPRLGVDRLGVTEAGRVDPQLDDDRLASSPHEVQPLDGAGRISEHTLVDDDHIGGCPLRRDDTSHVHDDAPPEDSRPRQHHRFNLRPALVAAFRSARSDPLSTRASTDDVGAGRPAARGEKTGEETMKWMWAIVGVSLLMAGLGMASEAGTVASAVGDGVFRPYGAPAGSRTSSRNSPPSVRTSPSWSRSARRCRARTSLPSRSPGMPAASVTAADRPLFYLGAEHAREWITPEMVRRLAHHVVDGYSIDPTLTELVDTTELWFVPVANPDGYDYTFTPGNRLWRKKPARQRRRRPTHGQRRRRPQPQLPDQRTGAMTTRARRPRQ